ncbi:flippase [Candidatus Woesearchaeota archaeon]|nr:flippase [Candidatus Woesearchaeota archaeon]
MRVFSVFENIGFLFVSDVISRLLSFGLFLAIAHTLGKSGLGDYSFIFAFVGLLVVFNDLGIQVLFVRDVAKNLARTSYILKNTLSMKVLLGLIVAFLTAVAVNFTNVSAEVVLSVYIVALATFFFSLKTMFLAVFYAHERMLFVAFATMLEMFLAVVLGVSAIISGYGLVGLSFAFLMSYFVVFVVSIVAVRRLTTISFGFNLDFQKRFLRSSLPFWFSGLFMAIYFRIDTVMISLIKGSAETGLYNASYRLLDALYFIPSAVIGAVFPAMSRLHVKNKNVLRSLYRKSFYYLLAIALPMGVGVTMLAERLTLFIFGSGFSGTHLALQILIWALVAIFLSSLTGFLMNAVNKQLLFTLTTAFAALLNVALNLFFIPLWSYIGAAISTVMTEFFVLILLVYFARKNSYAFDMFRTLLKPVAATAFMAVVIFALLNFHIMLIVPVAATAYFVMLFLIGGLEKEEFHLLKGYLKRIF